MEKRIRDIKRLSFDQQMPGFKATGIMNSEYNIEPYLVFGEFYMDRPVFGPHAHAGISVMTYVLPDSIGSFLNRDSLGDHSIIGPGGVHVTQTGSGIYHDELPEVSGREGHAFQIWINHADKDRLIAPTAFNLPANKVPLWRGENIEIRIIQGHYKDLKSPLELVTKTLLFDVTLKSNAMVALDTEEMAFIYLISGAIIVEDNEIKARGMVTFKENGNKIFVKTGADPANFMFASATPHHEPIVYSGPFVMTTQKQMTETQARLSRREMGFLNAL